MTKCDYCGDESNSDPGLPCGRVDSDESEPCPGVYRECTIRPARSAGPMGRYYVVSPCGHYKARIAESQPDSTPRHTRRCPVCKQEYLIAIEVNAGAGTEAAAWLTIPKGARHDRA